MIKIITDNELDEKIQKTKEIGEEVLSTLQSTLELPQEEIPKGLNAILRTFCQYFGSKEPSS